MMNKLGMQFQQVLTKFRQSASGVAYIEFALVLPLLLMFFAGGIELTRYAMANQKVDKASNAIADYYAQQVDPSAVNMQELFDYTMKDLMAPFGTQEMQVIVSDIQPRNALNPNLPIDAINPLQVNWQRSTGDGVGSSQLGSQGGAAASPVGEMELKRNERLIGTEVYFRYNTLIPGVLSALGAFGEGLKQLDNNVFYKRSVVRYRLANSRQAEEGTPGTPTGLNNCCGYYCDPWPNAEEEVGSTWQPYCACNGGCAPNQAFLDYYGVDGENGGLCTSVCEPTGPGTPGCQATNTCNPGGG